MSGVGRFVVSLLLAMIGSVVIVLVLNPEVVRTLPWLQQTEVQLFQTMWIGIILEALPFVLIGVVLAAVVEAFVPDAWFQRCIPRSVWWATVAGSALGLVFPICECGMVPVVRRLMQKGMPVHMGVAFLLAGPIVNPVVFSSTSLALRTQPELVWWRMGLALLVAWTVGWLVHRFVRIDVFKPVTALAERSSPVVQGVSYPARIVRLLDHAGGEAFEMMGFVIFGAAITAWMQTMIAREQLVAIGDQGLLSVVMMMLFGFLLSICSTADAFVVAPLVPLFSPAAILAFLVFGPMFDIKSVIMMLSAFRVRFVFWLLGVVAMSVFFWAVVSDMIL